MTAEASKAKAGKGDPFAHVTAAGWGRGLNALMRITRMCFRHPWQAGAAIGSTFVAAGLQLTIPRLLGRAVDESQQALAGAGAARDALWATALLLFAVSVLRGLFTMVQNYYGESVGHHVGYELRLAFYEKIQRLSFGFHDRVHSGDLITIGMLDLEGVRMFFSTGIVRLVLLTVLIGAGAWLLISTDPVLGLLSLSFVPFVAWRSSFMHLTPPRHLARAAGAPLRPDPRHGGEPRRHPRRARLRRAGARDGASSTPPRAPRWPSATGGWTCASGTPAPCRSPSSPPWASSSSSAATRSPRAR